MSRQHWGTSAVAVPEVRAHLLIWPAVASSPHSHTQLGYPTRDTELAPGFEVGFVTDHVFEAFEQATGADARPLHEPERMSWGQTVGYLSDLNGVLIVIGTPPER